MKENRQNKFRKVFFEIPFCEGNALLKKCQHSKNRTKYVYFVGRRKKSSKLKDDKISTEATEIEVISKKIIHI